MEKFSLHTFFVVVAAVIVVTILVIIPPPVLPFILMLYNSEGALISYAWKFI